ncbi:MAG TPA: YIP1 family protein [Herpetosiphonaceae bacterium]
MNTSTASLSEMFNSSIAVLTKPSVAPVEMYERRGTLQTALIYVAIAAVVGAVIGLLGGIAGAVGSFVSVFITFLLFTGTTYYVGKSQGGTGTFDEVAYTFSLFWVPLSLASTVIITILAITIVGLCLVPFVALAVLVAQVYFAYLAVQSSMNLVDRNKVLITLAAAAVVTFLGNYLITSIIT